ncbi:hypothetical protein [Blastococcus haudaquaticus]|uniref:Uncharacterized protein n=1 Tax=Blastococcus haudaquaticus TaxID=1938745 RepID=A0A286GTH7_9ACTN|nr:hypothetical protein [Blastococcus haudaquaticus]SOD98274.1 hypothetical protein SAMN06272739_1818 [Blastococcus haudaquaticus]
MDERTRSELFDPASAHQLVLARRPPIASAVHCVVSDVVWHEVVKLLRWAAADTGGATGLESGRWWRLAAACADLLRRLPSLSDELDEAWSPAPEVTVPGLDGAARVDLAAGRLLALLRSSDPVPLQWLAAEVDALGAAAISALADRDPWTLPELP